MGEGDSSFNGPQGVLAHAYMPQDGGSWNGEIHMDEHEFWALKNNPYGKHVVILYYTCITP